MTDLGKLIQNKLYDNESHAQQVPHLGIFLTDRSEQVAYFHWAMTGWHYLVALTRDVIIHCYSTQNKSVHYV